MIGWRLGQWVLCALIMTICVGGPLWLAVVLS